MLFLAILATGNIVVQSESKPAKETAKEKKAKEEKKKGSLGAAITRFGERTTGNNMTNEVLIVNQLSDFST